MLLQRPNLLSKAEQLAERADAALLRGGAAKEARLTTAKAAMAATKEGWNYANKAWYAEVVAVVW